MKNQTLIISFILVFCCVNINAQPPGYDARCEDYLVNFCRDILSKANNDCLQWGIRSEYDAYCSRPEFSQYITNIPINRTGGVMIGANSLLDSKLAVTEGIISTSLKVNSGTWPDYVFDPSYRLMPLSDVKKYVTTNKHLPNTPSASDIDRDGGFNVGETFINHQEKIEEIFLHLIALKKQATSLQKEEADLDVAQIELMLALSERISKARSTSR